MCSAKDVLLVSRSRNDKPVGGWVDYAFLKWGYVNVHRSVGVTAKMVGAAGIST
jgi:hypothetical protein